MDNDAGKQPIIWAHKPEQLSIFGEDGSASYYLRNIEALCYYNAFRNWPINRETTSGELDDENLSILISKSYLENKGYINSDGYLNFNGSEDRFIINGVVYKPSGDTQVAQAHDEALVFLIILKRDRDSELKNIINTARDSEGQPVFINTNTNKDYRDYAITHER